METASSQAGGDAFYDVVVVGGAFSGASTALLLRRWLPDCRVLVVERREAFDRKVGEATVELSALFLTRVLGLYDHLSREHLPKHGLRFWFPEGPPASLAELSEFGPFAVSMLPSFQLDRSRLDETLLRLAEEAGADVMRPARLDHVQPAWPESRMTVRDADGNERSVRCRWIVDASGRHNFLGRRLGLLRQVDEHPIAAAWGRWRNVKDLDGLEAMGPDPAAARLPHVAASRRLATNHFCGYGWWVWVIPLQGGETSIGVVYDKRYFRWPVDGRPEEQYVRFLKGVDGLSELLEGAELEPSDFRGNGHLPYRCSRYIDRGWSLVGDAAAFNDPFYSPGLDHASFTIYATARLIQHDLESGLSDDDLMRAVDDHNDRFLRSCRNWLDALYIDKYEILGDAELTVTSMIVDTAMYYLGVVGPATRNIEELNNPVLGLNRLRVDVAFRAMRFFRRRMVRLARFRRRVGFYGRRNRGWRYPARRFGIGVDALWMLLSGFRLWVRAEAQYLGYRLRHGRVDVSSPVPPTPPIR